MSAPDYSHLTNDALRVACPACAKAAAKFDRLGMRMAWQT